MVAQLLAIVDICGRSGMPQDGLDADERLPRRMRGQPETSKDVFALIKSHMSDSKLCQRPLLVWPQAMLGKTRDFFAGMNRGAKTLRADFNEERAEELRLIASAVRKDFPQLSRAAAFYDAALDPNSKREPFPEITFCAHAAADPGRWHRVELGQRAPPPRAHELQVVFHHDRRAD